MPISVAAFSHPGLFAAVLLFGFALGACGHLMRSRAVILAGIAVIALVSLYFVVTGEAHTA